MVASPGDLMEAVNDTIYFEGEITEEVIAGLLKKVSGLNTSDTVRSRLKIILIELCTNIISHHSGTPHGEVKVNLTAAGCMMSISSFVNKHDFHIVERLLDEVKQQVNYEEYYFNKLSKNPDENKSARLGLARIYKMCRGRIDLESTLVVSKTKLTINLELDDKN